MPAILKAPAPLLVKQWQIMYDTGKLTLPPLAIGSGAIFGYLAYRCEFLSRSTHIPTAREPKIIDFLTATPDSTPRALYTAAAVLLPSIVPYTILLLKPINDKLTAMANISDMSERLETAHALVDKWGTLNLIRSLLPLAGAVLAALATADKYELMTLSSVTLKSGANRMG